MIKSKKDYKLHWSRRVLQVAAMW